jgi:DNA-binding transcriptional LysR family regulator
MDRIDEWRVFAAIAARGSFTEAARALGRSPQAVTRAIAALERRVGTRLLDRTTRKVAVSRDGVRYLERCRRVLADVDALEEPVDPRAPLTGTVAITAPVLYGQLHVMPVVAELLAAHPGVAARLLLVDRIVSLVEEGIDVAVRIGELADSALIARPLGRMRTMVCASPAYLERAGVPRRPEALAEHACIGFTATSALAERWAFAGATVRVQPRLVVNSVPAKIAAAVAGLGLVRVYSYQVDGLVASGELAVVLARHEPAPVPIHLVYPAGPQSRAAAAFVELARRRMS